MKKSINVCKPLPPPPLHCGFHHHHHRRSLRTAHPSLPLRGASLMPSRYRTLSGHAYPCCGTSSIWVLSATVLTLPWPRPVPEKQTKGYPLSFDASFTLFLYFFFKIIFFVLHAFFCAFFSRHSRVFDAAVLTSFTRCSRVSSDSFRHLPRGVYALCLRLTRAIYALFMRPSRVFHASLFLCVLPASL